MRKFLNPFLFSILIALFSLFSTQSAVAEKSQARESGRNSADLTRFDNFTMLTIPGWAGQLNVKHFPTKAVVELHFSKGVPRKLRKKLKRKVVVGRNPRDILWRSPDLLQIRFRSMASDIKVSPMAAGSGNLVFIGKLKKIQSTSRHLFKDDCMQLFKHFKATEDDHIFKAYCNGESLGEYQENHEETSEQSNSEPRRHVLRILRYQEKNPATKASPQALMKRVNRSSMAPAVVEYGLLSVAMSHAVRDHAKKALKKLKELETYHMEYKNRDAMVFSSAQQALVDRLGHGMFERYMRYLFAKGPDGYARAIANYEEFADWEGPDFDINLKWKIADTYRKMLMPGRAIQQYMELLERKEGMEARKLEALVATYTESGDPYRAYATLRYLRERYPGYDIDNSIKVKAKDGESELSK